MDVMDCIDVIAPMKQLVIEVDHSAGHAKISRGRASCTEHVREIRRQAENFT